MLVSLIIVFREIMEAGLIVGIVLAATEGVPRRGRWISGGIAILGANLVALFAAALSKASSGAGQEVFTATILGFAVLVLTWHVAFGATPATAHGSLRWRLKVEVPF